MPKQMPGYQVYQNKITAEQNRVAAAKKKVDETNKQEKLRAAKEKIVSNVVGNKYPVFPRFLRNFFIGQIGLFICGSILFAMGPDAELPDEVYEKYSRMSYLDGIKDAYGISNTKSTTPYWTLFCSIIILYIAAAEAKKHAKTMNAKRQNNIDQVLSKLEQLKDYGIDANKLITNLTPSIKKVLESLSKIDRGYFDNLAAGGLDTANYETCVAIISGYLKAHPKEYNNVIAIIDEATLPPEIVKKYGKGNTISFAATQAMEFNK